MVTASGTPSKSVVKRNIDSVRNCNIVPGRYEGFAPEQDGETTANGKGNNVNGQRWPSVLNAGKRLLTESRLAGEKQGFPFLAHNSPQGRSLELCKLTDRQQQAILHPMPGVVEGRPNLVNLLIEV